MSRVSGERVLCHECEHQWDRQQGGIVCPECHSEFCEILERGMILADDDFNENDLFHHFDRPAMPPPLDHRSRERSASPPMLGMPGGFGGLFVAPWMQDHDHVHAPRGFTNTNMNSAPNVMRWEFTNHGPSGRMYFSTSSFSATSGHGMPRGDHPIHGQAQPNINDIFSLMLGHLQQNQQPAQAHPLDILTQFLNPSGAARGDMVFSNEEMDRVMTQLMQSTNQGAPPASEEAVSRLPTKKVDEEMLGPENKAECSICMDDVEKGTEVTVLPCSHWFHGDCVKAWLKEHDTCPHCRKSIGMPDPPKGQSSASGSSGNRRSSRLNSRRDSGRREAERRNSGRAEGSSRRDSRTQADQQSSRGLFGSIRDRLSGGGPP